MELIVTQILSWGPAGIIGAFVAFAVLPAGFAVWRISSQQVLEQKRGYRKRQLDLCFEIAALVGRIVVLEIGPERAAIVGRFWQIYFGELSLCEDKALARAMERFGEALVAMTSYFPDIQLLERDPDTMEKYRRETLQMDIKNFVRDPGSRFLESSAAVGVACRELIERQWRVGLKRIAQPRRLRM